MSTLLDDIIKNSVHYKMMAIKNGAGEEDSIIAGMVMMCGKDDTNKEFESFTRR